MSRGIRVAAVLLSVDIFAIVLSGGVSLLGPAATTGFLLRAFLFQCCRLFGFIPPKHIKIAQDNLPMVGVSLRVYP